jgi:NSS family neurotransmitter:Na+ symporter
MAKTNAKNGFASGIGFALAAAGSAIGLGNLWSFPYKTSANGGAAFVIVYIISVLLFGAIVMIAEMYIGKRAQANPITSYKKINKNMGWLGVFAIIIPMIIICYYSALGGYTVKFTLNSFNDNSNVLTTFSGNIGEVIMYTLIFIVLKLLT